jgi:hypothetical protein
MIRRVLIVSFFLVIVAGCGSESKAPTPAARTPAGGTPAAQITRAGTPAAQTPQAPKLLDTKRVAAAITTSIRTQRGAKARVSCPTAVKQAKGVNFVCSARSKFGTTVFAVIQNDAVGHVTYTASEPR